MNDISKLIFNDIKRQTNPESYIIQFFKFYLNNYNIIHKEITLLKIRQLSVLEPYISINKERLSDIDLFDNYISILDNLNEDSMIGNVLHFTHVDNMFKESILYNGILFCISENIDINHHSQEELDLFRINIIS